MPPPPPIIVSLSSSKRRERRKGPEVGTINGEEGEEENDEESIFDVEGRRNEPEACTSPEFVLLREEW